jgi:hypothetical protein
MRPAAADMRPAAADMRPAEEDMRPAEEDMRLAAAEMRLAAEDTPEEPAEYLAAAAMAEAALRPAARSVERPLAFRRPRRMRQSGHWPLRIVDKRHCSSRVSLKLRLRIQITG